MGEEAGKESKGGRTEEGKRREGREGKIWKGRRQGIDREGKVEKERG